MAYSKREPEFATHKECAHFSNGFCTLNGVQVSPNLPACPNFTPRSMTITPQAMRRYQQLRRPLQFSPLSRQDLSAPLAHLQDRSQTTIHHLGHGYMAFQHGYGFLRRSGAGVYSMSGGRGGGRGKGRGGGGRGRGRMGGFAAGPGGSCVCPSCGYTEPHKLGSPCFQQRCPKCGTPMTRKT